MGPFSIGGKPSCPDERAHAYDLLDLILRFSSTRGQMSRASTRRVFSSYLEAPVTRLPD